MQVNYELTESDFRCGMRACRNKSVWTRWAYRFRKTVSILFLVLIAVMFVADARGRDTLRNSTPLVVIVALWNLWVWVGPYLAARSQFRGSRAAHGPKTLSASATELSFQTDVGSSHLQWTGFVNWVEGKQVFALFTSPKAFIVLPKRAFTPEQLGEFRELLRQNIR